MIKIIIPCLAGTDGRVVDKLLTEQTNDARGKWSNVLLGECNQQERAKDKKKPPILKAILIKHEVERRKLPNFMAILTKYEENIIKSKFNMLLGGMQSTGESER